MPVWETSREFRMPPRGPTPELAYETQQRLSSDQQERLWYQILHQVSIEYASTSCEHLQVVTQRLSIWKASFCPYSTELTLPE